LGSVGHPRGTIRSSHIDVQAQGVTPPLALPPCGRMMPPPPCPLHSPGLKFVMPSQRAWQEAQNGTCMSDHDER
jgi:hypothetical protein